MKNAIIFDLDGTMWDAVNQIYIIWNRVFERHAQIKLRVSEELLSEHMGKTMEELGRMLFPEASEEFQKQLMDECGVEEVVYLREHGAVLYDKVADTLRKLKEDYDLYIVSNCQEGYVEAFMHAHGFEDVFLDIEMSGRTGKVKGENIRLLMERNGIEKAVYVGDTAGDEKASHFAGIPFIFAKYGFGKAVSPDAEISSFAELPDIVKVLYENTP